jgi:hypothetical protein
MVVFREREPLRHHVTIGNPPGYSAVESVDDGGQVGDTVGGVVLDDRLNERGGHALDEALLIAAILIAAVLVDTVLVDAVLSKAVIITGS